MRSSNVLVCFAGRYQDGSGQVFFDNSLFVANFSGGDSTRYCLSDDYGSKLSRSIRLYAIAGVALLIMLLSSEMMLVRQQPDRADLPAGSNGFAGGDCSLLNLENVGSGDNHEPTIVGCIVCTRILARTGFHAMFGFAVTLRPAAIPTTLSHPPSTDHDHDHGGNVVEMLDGVVFNQLGPLARD